MFSFLPVHQNRNYSGRVSKVENYFSFEGSMYVFVQYVHKEI